MLINRWRDYPGFPLCTTRKLLSRVRFSCPIVETINRRNFTIESFHWASWIFNTWRRVGHGICTEMTAWRSTNDRWWIRTTSFICCGLRLQRLIATIGLKSKGKHYYTHPPMVEGYTVKRNVSKNICFHCRAGENKCGEQRNLRKRLRDNIRRDFFKRGI